LSSASDPRRLQTSDVDLPEPVDHDIDRVGKRTAFIVPQDRNGLRVQEIALRGNRVE